MSEGRKLLHALKIAAGAPGPVIGLRVDGPFPVFLRPVATREGQLNPQDVGCLTKWRNKFVTSFLNEFEANDDQTSRWLLNLVGPDDTRILFMLDDATGKTFGYMGLAFIDWQNHYVEADAIVRGAEAPSGTMLKALRALLSWAKYQLGLKHIQVRVRSDNPACDFYRKVGFVEYQRVGLRRTEHPNKIEWVEDPLLEKASVHLVYMRAGEGMV